MFSIQRDFCSRVWMDISLTRDKLDSWRRVYAIWSQNCFLRAELIEWFQLKHWVSLLRQLTEQVKWKGLVQWMRRRIRNIWTFCEKEKSIKINIKVDKRIKPDNKNKKTDELLSFLFALLSIATELVSIPQANNFSFSANDAIADVLK